MRNYQDLRVDESTMTKSGIRTIALDPSALKTTSADESVENRTRSESGGDVIDGIRNALVLSAAFWALVYFAGFLILS